MRFGEEELHRIRTVLRLRPGDFLLATDGTGVEYRLRLAASGEGLEAVIEGREEPDRESPLQVVLVQALAKKERMDFVVQKAVELGVSAIRPVMSSRTVVHLEKGREEARRERWRKIAAAALAQSGRTRMPVLEDLCSWREFLRRETTAELKIMLCEGGGDSLAGLTRGRKAPSSAVVAVGPEGGWTPEEIAAARRGGFATAVLGPRILRTETAGLAVLAVLQFLFGDLGEGKKAVEDSAGGDEGL